MLRVGVDSTKFRGIGDGSAARVLEASAEHGLDGVFFRSMFELSPALDPGELAELAARAAELGQHVESGVGKVNPFATPEAPEVRELGGGDYLHGMRLMIEAAAGIGITELWTATANYQFRLSGLFTCDRFRTDAPWSEQLAATERFLRMLAPILRDNGVHLNLETHEEITTFELVRLVEAVGPDVLGITFDSANVLVRCEDPIAAVRRAAPYVRATHLRDAALFFRPEGIARILTPVGEGVIDWDQLLAPLLVPGRDGQPERDLMLSVEGVVEETRGEMHLQIHDPRWQAGHPDLTVPETLEVIRLTTDYEARAAAGEAPDWAALHTDVGEAESLDFILRSADALRDTIARLTAPNRIDNEGETR